MKILAFNGSPRMGQGATDILLNHFLRGATTERAEVEKIYLRERQIGVCTSCFTCWKETPGVCALKDDMTEAMRLLREADLWVFATPVYSDTMTAYTKMVMERMLPLLEPTVTKVGGRNCHPLRYPEDEGKHAMILISCCGFPERDNFDPLRLTFQRFSANYHAPLLGEILMPAAHVLLRETGRQTYTRLLQAIVQAGAEVAATGHISDETKAILR